MVTWYGDGEVSGFGLSAATTGSMDPAAYLLVQTSPGTVDANGITRLQVSLPTLLNRIAVQQIRLRITAADVSANSGRRLTATMFVAPDYLFSPGAVPSPSMILAQGPLLRAWRSATSFNAAGDRVFTINGPRAQDLQPNTRYWVLVLPTSVSDMSLPANYVNDRAMNLGSENTTGKAISLWTNRTPTQPVITSPDSGRTAASGTSFSLQFTVGDLDTVSGGSDTHFYDLAGVQVQYAPRPTVAEPNPTWTNLPIANTAGTAMRKGWYIDRSASNNPDESAGIWQNRTLNVVCGSNTPVASSGALPSGEWQIRVRTFDYGHPQPTAYPPLGRTNLTPANYPASNTSLWSDPIMVNVTAQTPTPVPLSPINNTAIPEGLPVNLVWQYRNTYVPPFPQAKRAIQMRKVGDPNWTDVVSGNSSASSFIVPPRSVTVLDNGTSITGWSRSVNATSGPTLTGGSVQIGTTNSDGIMWAARTLTATTGPTRVTIKGRRRGPSWSALDPEVNALLTSFFLSGVGVTATLVSATNNANATYTALTDFELVYDVAGPFNEFRAALYYGAYNAAYPTTLQVTSVEIASGFDLSATTHFEWRVQVEDSSGSANGISNWSNVGRFWIVPAPASGTVRPLPAETIEGATLGCGEYRAFIYKRGGTERVGEITNITQLDWGRVRDDISTAKVTVKGWDIDCGNLLARLQCWAYELVLFRDNGYSVDRVWEGPLTLLTYRNDSVVISARDVMAYAYRRIIKQKMTDSGEGRTVVARAAQVLQNVFAPDDPNVLAHLQIISREDDALQFRSLMPYSRTAYEEVDDMAANAGLDYTIVGRSILVWGVKHRIGTLPEFRDMDLGAPPIVSEYGMSMANRYVVSDGNGVWGEATRLNDDGDDPDYGLVEILSSTWASDSEVDNGSLSQSSIQKIRDSFAEGAERSIADRYMPGSPVVVRVPDNTTLNPGTVITIQHLVPGVAIPLRSNGTLRTVRATQKLDSVQVSVEAGVETVKITLSPFSRDDASYEETGDE